jgi:hypothetical protein
MDQLWTNIRNIGKYRRASSEDDDPSGVITHMPALDARLNIVHMLMETRRQNIKLAKFIEN